jgi:adenine-specific DNA-methyltransferase
MTSTPQKSAHPIQTPAPGRERHPFPRTRYLGSKYKLLGLLEEVFSRIEFEAALDPFSGTGAVAYLLKQMGARVTASDVMAFNVAAARALVENPQVRLAGGIDALLYAVARDTGTRGFVERRFDGIFFYRKENRFIDHFLHAIAGLAGYERDIALFALGQACLIKRPYNLFHRANLAMRSRDVERSFGNKTTWDKPFDGLVRQFAREADSAVFDSGKPCRAIRSDVLAVDPVGFDLVYLDPPYISCKGMPVDYLDYYHFLEGLAEPETWPARILTRYKHKPLQGRGESPWCDPRRIAGVFEAAIRRFAESAIVISYRSDGIPSIDDLTRCLERAGKRVTVVDAGQYTYALSRNKRSREVVLVGQ